MSEQMSLPIRDLVVPEHHAKATIGERFDAFHAANPWIADTLEKMTGDRLAAGHKRVGIGMLFEVLRWQAGLNTRGEEFRLNNNFRSRYARLLIDRHPEWADAFELRELRAA